MLCLICKYYLNITFLPRSNINRLLNFTDVYICFWFSVKKVLLILGLTKCNTKFVFFCFILPFSFCTLFIKRKKEWFKKNEEGFNFNILSIIQTLHEWIITIIFKVGLSPSKKILNCFNDSPAKMMKNAFCFISKAVYILKIFIFLS